MPLQGTGLINKKNTPSLSALYTIMNIPIESIINPAIHFFVDHAGYMQNDSEPVGIDNC